MKKMILILLILLLTDHQDLMIASTDVRSLVRKNALFYADGLSKIIKNILTKTEDKDKLVITEDFFENISKYKNQ